MSHPRFALLVASVVLCACSSGEVAGESTVLLTEPPTGSEEPPVGEAPPANEQAPVSASESPPCRGETSAIEEFELRVQAICEQARRCPEPAACTPADGCINCAGCFERCRCAGGSARECRSLCGPEEREESTTGWAEFCAQGSACLADISCASTQGVALPVCPSEVLACYRAALDAMGCGQAEVSLWSIPACALVADLLEGAGEQEEADLEASQDQGEQW